jgi:hypothetical protein
MQRRLVVTDVSGQPTGPIVPTLKMGPIGCHETSVTNDNSTLRNIPEGWVSHLRRGGSLKPHLQVNLRKARTICNQQHTECMAWTREIENARDMRNENFMAVKTAVVVIP